MKKFITTIVSLLMVIILSAPVYAEDFSTFDTEDWTPINYEESTYADGDTLWDDEEIPHQHQMSEWFVTVEPTCTTEGTEERMCIDPECPDIDGSWETRQIPALGHQWGNWVSTIAATIYGGGVNTQTCNRCGMQNRINTAIVIPYVSWAYKVTKLPRKSKAVFSVNLANGDYVTKWKSSKKKVASVSASGVVKAKKNGKTKITAYTASGLKITCTVKVVKPSKKKKKASSGGTVYWTPGGKVYHRSASCPTLARSRTVYSGTKKESGKSRCCKVCG